MTMARRVQRVSIGLGILTLMLFVVLGCAGMNPQGGGASAVTKAEKGPLPVYYDFGDVLVPKELEVQKKDSFVYKTPEMTTGVLSLKGHVDYSSLISFFENNMVRDGWKEVSSMKSSRTVMLFKKQTRWCVISISEGSWYTYAEIWVTPEIAETQAGSGLLK